MAMLEAITSWPEVPEAPSAAVPNLATITVEATTAIMKATEVAAIRAIETIMLAAQFA